MKNKVLSVLLAICFMLSSLTISTFAEEINNTDDSIQMETQATPQAETLTVTLTKVSQVITKFYHTP